jgi:methionyl-tRNA synthetase
MEKRNEIVDNQKNFYITTPIYYVNSEPHIGGIYTTLMSDTINRFKKLNNVNTRFLTGTDEHGQKIQQTAEKAGVNEQDFVDRVAKVFRDVADHMKFGYDDFIRTTEQRHKKFVQNIWKILVKNDWIYRGKYCGWYCVSDEAYYKENELLKQADGSFRTEIGKTVEWKEEESYFFRLSEFQDILLKLYKNTDFIQPNSKKNEVVAFVGGSNIKDIERDGYIKGFLQDLSISRNNFSWGIKIPCDDEGKILLDDNGEWESGVKEEEKHVIYVWLDALFNYQSALESVGKFDEFWKSAEVVHFVGKDILKFHTVYWPAFLMAVEYSRDEFKNVELENILERRILPTTVFAHGWWTNEGRKISKSFGNAISAESEMGWLAQEYGLTEDVAMDFFKYYLTTETPFGSDGDYSRSRLVEKINAELVNNIGNLIQRVLTMIYRDCAGIIGDIEIEKNSNMSDLLMSKTINKFDFQTYKDVIVDIANKSNNHMEEAAPWNLKKSGKIDEMIGVLKYQMVNIIQIAILLQPLCPFISGQILDFLNLTDRSFGTLCNGVILKNIKVMEPKGFFPRLQKVNI